MSIACHTERVKKVEKEFDGDLFFRLSSPQKISKKTNRAWSLPAGPSYACPGATDACEGCYATKGRHVFPNVQKSFLRNWLLMKKYERENDVPSTVEAIEELLPSRKSKTLIFRIHESGDFHSQFAVDVWKSVVEKRPDIQFWTYTRSFHLDFSGLVSLPNFRLWASTDTYNIQEAQTFTQRYPGVLHAYGPWEHGVDKPEKSFYCPATVKRDNGKMKLEGPGQCEKCKLCFSPKIKRHVVFLEH